MGGSLQLQGDETQLFERHAASLERVVASQVGAPQAVIEDACANAWLILLRRQPDREAVWSWLKVVAIHEAWKLNGKETRELPFDDVLFELIGRDDLAERVAFHEELATLSQSVTDRQRRLLAMHVAGFTYAEIAEMTGYTWRTVERQLLRARRRARAGR